MASEEAALRAELAAGGGRAHTEEALQALQRRARAALPRVREQSAFEEVLVAAVRGGCKFLLDATLWYAPATYRAHTQPCT
jgi:hypothetical protein